jgi:hypothetical protein
VKNSKESETWDARKKGLAETAHLLRSKANAKRLFDALRSSQLHKGKPESIGELRREMGLEK